MGMGTRSMKNYRYLLIFIVLVGMGGEKNFTNRCSDLERWGGYFVRVSFERRFFLVSLSQSSPFSATGTGRKRFLHFLIASSVFN